MDDKSKTATVLLTLCFLLVAISSLFLFQILSYGSSLIKNFLADLFHSAICLCYRVWTETQMGASLIQSSFSVYKSFIKIERQGQQEATGHTEDKKRDVESYSGY